MLNFFAEYFAAKRPRTKHATILAMEPAEIRLVRDGIVIHEGKISSLKRFKDDAKEVATGYECGIGIEAYNDIKEGDIIECFHMVEIERN